MKKSSISLTIFIGLFLLVGAASAQLGEARPAGQPLTAAQWQADLTSMAEQMQRQHPNLFRRIQKTEFDAAISGLNARIPTLGQDEILTGFMKIVAMVKDGHSGLFPAEYFRSGVFPVRFYQFDDGLFIQRAAPAYAGLAGAKVVRVGDKSADEAMRLAGTIVGADNEMGVRENAPLFLSIPELLHGLGLIGGSDLRLTLEKGGKTTTVQIKPAFTVNDLIRPPADWADMATKKPLYLQHPDDIYWFQYLPNEKLVYIQQNAVQNKPDETVSKFYKRAMDLVAGNPVEKLVIDLRRNDGGNNGLNRPVVISLIRSKINERGKLYVITGRMTFSAAQNFVNELEKYTNATFVGEPTAGRPNHYGDGRSFTLPNSRLNVQVSTLYWQDMDPRDNRQWTAPGIAASLSSDDYRSGIDPALQAVLDDRGGDGLQALTDAAAGQKDIGIFLRQYSSFKADPKHRYVETEAAVNRLGYNLLQSKRAADAVEVFKLNVIANPRSANAYDSLGDGYAALGNRDEAIKNYEKALSIDPNFTSSAESLAKLRARP